MNIENREVKGAGIVLALLLLALSASIFVPRPFGADCTSQAFANVASPDGVRFAEVRHRRCQSEETGELSVKLGDVNRPNQFFSAFCAPVAADRVFSPTSVPISVNWTGNRELVVTYPSSLISSCSNDRRPLDTHIILDRRDSKPGS